jgi:hypothetical protein
LFLESDLSIKLANKAQCLLEGIDKSDFALFNLSLNGFLGQFQVEFPLPLISVESESVV